MGFYLDNDLNGEQGIKLISVSAQLRTEHTKGHDES